MGDNITASAFSIIGKTLKVFAFSFQAAITFIFGLKFIGASFLMELFQCPPSFLFCVGRIRRNYFKLKFSYWVGITFDYFAEFPLIYQGIYR